MSDNNLIFKYNNNEYKLLVSDTESGSIGLKMKDLKTNKITDVTIGALRGQTPDCVIVNNDENLIKAFIEAKIFEYCNGIFAKIDVNELYKYDNENVKTFIEKYATAIKYRQDIGNTKEEIKKNITKDSKEIFKKEEIKEFFDDHTINMNYFMYSVLDNNNIKDSFAVFCDVGDEFIAIVQPYRDNINTQIDIVRDYQYSIENGFFSYLNDDCQIIHVNRNSHPYIMQGLEEIYPDFKYKNGVKKYLKYCIDKKVDKEEYMKDFKEMSKMMKEIKNKLKERDR